MKPDSVSSLVLKRDGAQPLYAALAEHIESQIQSGELKVGDRLPAQREFAQRLGLNLTTVTRAFRVLSRKGLIVSKAGRGSCVVVPVSGPERTDYPSAPQPDMLDLTVNRPATDAFLTVLPDILKFLPSDPRHATLQDYQPPEGASWLRSALAGWLCATKGLGHVREEQILVTSGAQHALDAILRSLCRPGDYILADAVTYQGVVGLCAMHHLRLVGVAMDDEGMMPDSLDAACRAERPKAIVLVPTLHNPTAITLSAERRQALVRVAEKHAIPIIEDDVYRDLHDDPGPSLASLAPAQTYYIGGFSKSIAPGMRTGFIVAPPDGAAAIATALRINNWCANPLGMWIAAYLIESGLARDIIRQQKAELAQRQALLTRMLGEFDLNTYHTSTHAWLKLPARWSTARFVVAARRRGVAVLGSDLFTLEGADEACPAVRLNVGAPRSQDALHKALDILRATLKSGDALAAGAF
ncbi:MAG: PLP-dependent aminotransferase family protein [Castellaniella sp.]|uniref:aminotransferase-like domain-containing protein n=1 Tax=Castellaniella sp. TaxID=1955812 RepID=UPI003C72D738